MKKKPTIEEDILETLRQVEGYRRKRRVSKTVEKLPKPEEPKTYKQYIAEAKPIEYYLNKYNKKP